MGKYKKLSIDAWANCCGCDHSENDKEACWTWNNWFTLGHTDKLPETLEEFVEEFDGYTGKGNIEDHYELEDDGYNIVLIKKDTREPCYAVEYGSVYE